MLAHTIDANGYMLEPVMVPDGTKNSATVVVMRCPDGFYKPQWNGTEWAEGADAAALLSVAKVQKISELNDSFARTLAAGYTSNATGTTYTYDLKPSDDLAWRKLKDAIDLGAFPSGGYPLKCVDASRNIQYITHTQAQATSILQAGANFELSQETNLRNKINDASAAITVSSVQSVTY